MSKSKYLLFTLFFMPAVFGHAQNKEAVSLKWMLQPGETIAYKTIMQELDTSGSISFNNPFGKMANDSVAAFGRKFFKDLRSFAGQQSYVTFLKEIKKNSIDVEMRMLNDSDKAKADTTKPGSDFQKYKELLGKMNDGIMLRGIINEDGIVESFYTKREQQNLIAMFFQLPGKPVKVSDSWPLNVHLIAMDQNFVCDSSYNKNVVTVVDISDKNGDQAVTLKYDIVEYVNGNFTSPFQDEPVKTSMKMGYNGIAVFSTKKGRWLSYDGIMSNTSTGILSANSHQKISLVEGR